MSYNCSHSCEISSPEIISKIKRNFLPFKSHATTTYTRNLKMMMTDQKSGGISAIADKFKILSLLERKTQLKPLGIVLEQISKECNNQRREKKVSYNF